MNDNLFFILHFIFTISMTIIPFIINIKYVPLYIVFLLLIVFHWYFNEGQCIISIVHSKSTNNKSKSIKHYISKKYNIPIFIFDILLYLLLLISFYRIKKIVLGIITIIIILICNLINYNTIFFL